MTTVRIPADVDRPDHLLGGLTARQLAYLVVGALVVAGAWSATRSFVPLPLFAMAASPVAGLFAVVALARRDGMAGDALALAALRYARSNRRLVPAPEGVPVLPLGLVRSAVPAPLGFPVAGVEDSGVVDLGEAGLASVCRASSLNFGLRTEAEQRALVATFARWLNSLTAPVQLVVRAERVDVATAVATLRRGAASMASPGLEEAALAHADFLGELASRRDVLRRVVLVVFREPTGPGAVERLARRVADSASALAGAGIRVVSLGEEEALAALGRAIDPEARPRASGLARPGEVVRGRLA
ncbi:MAG TPA: PrgI family protein [Acidimicrobiales bacterium]|nr:PrgI family protein [Acidimicrobiales bacterium]